MQEFLVLGQVPGTSVEITFDMWLYGMVWLATICLLAVVLPIFSRLGYGVQARVRARRALKLLTQYNLL
ncbi:MAG: hypothetical protein WAQ24_00425 [Candidatus Saccharimonadales bacterium]